MDVFCLAILILYLGIIFVFSSYFYLATEDYEAVTAVEAIRAGQLIGKSTGWPYTPLAAYLFYSYSLGFGNDVAVIFPQLTPPSFDHASAITRWRLRRRICISVAE